MTVRWLMVTVVFAVGIWLAMDSKPSVQKTNIEPVEPARSLTKSSKTRVGKGPRIRTKKPTKPNLVDASVSVIEVADSGVVEADADVKPKGPFVIDLGTHTVYLKDPKHGRRIRLALTAQSRTEAGRIQVIRRKSRLIKMLFFLLSKRNPEAVERADAQDRLEDDLYTRFSRVVPGHALTALSIDSYQVLKKPKPDDESDESSD